MPIAQEAAAAAAMPDSVSALATKEADAPGPPEERAHTHGGGR